VIQLGRGLTATAVLTALSAAVNLAAGIALLRPHRGLLPECALLRLSVTWGVVLVLWLTYRMLNGAVHWAYLGSSVAAFFALVLSVVALHERLTGDRQMADSVGSATPREGAGRR
jgi:hypothetical protein